MIMRRFRFRLESILTLREHAEKEAELELGRRTGICAELQRQIQARHAERHRVLTTPHVTDAIDPVARAVTEHYAARLVHEAGILKTSLVTAESARAKALEVFTKAKRSADVLRGFRERQHAHHTLRERRGEQKRLDEVSQLIYLRNRQGELNEDG